MLDKSQNVPVFGSVTAGDFVCVTKIYHSNENVIFIAFFLRPRSSFLEEINKWTSQHGVSPLSWDVAVKFLMARKFDVLRAIELFHSYRVSVCLDNFNISILKTELLREREREREKKAMRIEISIPFLD